MTLTIANGIFFVSSYLAQVWVANRLGPGDYGIFGFVVVIFSTLNIVLISGIPQALPRFISGREDDAASVFRRLMLLQLAFSVILSIGLFISARPLAVLFHDDRLAGLIQWSASIVFLYGIATMYMNYYNALHRFTLQAVFRILNGVLKLIGIILLLQWFGLTGGVLGFAIPPIAIIIIALLDRKLPRSTHHEHLNFPWKTAISVVVPIILFSIAYELFVNIDILMAKSFGVSDADIGYYNATLQIGRMPFYVLNALASILLPGIARAVNQARHADAAQMIERSIRIIFITTVPMIIFSVAQGTFIFRFLFSPEFIAAVPLLQIFIFGSTFLVFFYTFANIFIGAGMQKMMLLLAVAGLAVNALLNIILIPAMGITGAALSTSIASAVSMIAAWVILWRRFRFPIQIRRMAVIVASALVIFSPTWFIHPSFLWGVLLFGVLASLYVLVLFLLKEVRRSDFHSSEKTHIISTTDHSSSI